MLIYLPLVGAILSTVDNPDDFDNFSANGVQQIASTYAKGKLEPIAYLSTSPPPGSTG
jgi:hypothetical protein